MSQQFTAAQIQHLKNRIATLKPTLGGNFLYRCIPFRKKVVLHNMRQVFSEVLSDQEIVKLSKAFYSHVAKSLKENIALRFISEKKLKQKAEVVGAQHMWDLLKHKVRGAILITGHFGNWEFAPIAGMLHFREFEGRFYFVRKLLGSKRIEKILFHRYYKSGLEVIPKKNSLNTVCDKLESNNAVVFVMDQHASLKAKDGVMVDFFGKPAGTFRSPAMIAKYTEVPVLPSRTYRREDGKHVLEFFPPLEWIKCENEKDEIAANTRVYNQWLEKFILEYPEQWLWMHKRWKTT